MPPRATLSRECSPAETAGATNGALAYSHSVPARQAIMRS